MQTNKLNLIVRGAVRFSVIATITCVAGAPSALGQSYDPPQVQPNVSQPSQTPPAPPTATPPPPQAGQAVMPPQESTPAQPDGQWVYTNQYGWIWAPYAQNYTYVTGDGAMAYEYAYYPSRGWTWLYSPWVLGWGPRPYWGALGSGHFMWYSHPWFRAAVGPRAGFVAPGRVYRGGGFGYGAVRGGAFRGGESFHGGGGHGGGHR